MLIGISIRDLALGRITTVIGRNAPGKTTLFECLAGLLKSRGSIRLDDAELRDLGSANVMRRVGYLLQEGPVNAVLTAFESLLLACKHTTTWRVSDDGPAVAAEVLLDLDIEHLSLRYLNEPGGGQKPMLSIVQVQARDTQVLLLDEPTSNLDPQRQLEVLDLLRVATAVRDMIALISLHDLNLAARFADHFVVMDAGQIYASGDAAPVLTAAMLKEVYQVNAKVRVDEYGITQATPVSSIGSRNGAVASAS